MLTNRRGNVISSYIMATWRHWAVSLGLVCISVVLAMVVSRHFLPYIIFAFAMMLGLLIYQHRGKRNKGLAIPYISALALLIEGALLTGFNITVSITDVYELAGHPVNEELPYIMQLSMSPVLAVTAAVFMLRRLGRGRFFRSRSGRSDVSIVQRMVWQETRYQTRMLFLISLGLSIVGWLYTFSSFNSVSINKPDMFFFVWMPVIVYFLSLVYLGFRCVSLWAFYSQNDPKMMINPHRSSVIRFLIVSGDRLYLTKRSLDVKQGMEAFYDTPARLRSQFTDSLSTMKAREMFVDYTGIEHDVDDVKFLFDGHGHDTDNRIFHYLCVIDNPEDVDASRVAGGEWFTLSQLKDLDRQHRLSAELTSELVHIHTVGMAWKSYDINGNRRYEIKNYRPTYRLSEIDNWDVDFTDPRWLQVARLNADKPFFKVRRFINRIMSPSTQ